MKRVSFLLVFIIFASAYTIPQVLPPPTSTTTTLSGFYDYQSNGGACKYVAVNPANGHVHVVYMTDFDSTNPGGAARRTVYAMSTDNGGSWNNFNYVVVPGRRSGFPCIDLLKTAEGYCTVIANHSDDGTGNCSHIYADCPEGGGAFEELSLPPNVCLQWPQIACTADSQIVLVGAGSVNGVDGVYVQRLDALTWTRLVPQTIAYYVVAASLADRVGVLVNLLSQGILLFESTDNGRTWPSTPRTIYPPQRVVGADTFQAYVGCDLTYFGNQPVAALHEYMTNTSAPTDSSRILFWSEMRGLVVAADKGHTPRVVARLNKPQARQMTMGYPAIGVVQQAVVIAYQAFMPETSMVGFNYSDLFVTESRDWGYSWNQGNLTHTLDLDERYPSISRTNWPSAPIFAHVAWQEDPQPGSAILDNAPVSRASQKYAQLEIYPAGRVEWGNPVVDHFVLEQNYPNPFNPSTTIRYAIPIGTHSRASLRVYDVLGREVAVLANELKDPGSYQVTWDARNQPSGVYFCSLNVGSFHAVRKLILMR